jgi:hypothetical protein
MQKKNSFEKNKMAQEAIQSYCRAQAKINEIDKTNEETKKTLSERVKTCRSIVFDELQRHKVRCIEVIPEGGQPVYFRLKQSFPDYVVSLNNILSILKNINTDEMYEEAEKNENDIPRIISAILQKELQTQRTTNTTTKETLVISDSKERGYDISQYTIADNTRQLANELLVAKKELKNFQNEQQTKKKISISEQKEAEPYVKTALKEMDPVSNTSRIHMLQNGNEWIYYLRLREQKKKTKVGIRVVVPLVEDAAAEVLKMQGMSREFNTSTKKLFWTSFLDRVKHEYEHLESKEKISSRLSLDRGPPRKKK